MPPPQLPKPTSCAGFVATEGARPPSNSRWWRRSSSPFCFAIIELALVFFASQILETVTQDTSRLIMTGQAQERSYTQASFKDAVLRQAHRDVRLRERCLDRRAELQGVLCVNIADPIDAGKNFRSTEQLSPGRPGDIVVVRLFLQMAAVRHRPGLQSREYRRQQAAADGDRRIPERTLLGPRAMKPMKKIWLRMRRRAFELVGNNSGVAAIEFALIIPVMAVMFVGTNEFLGRRRRRPQGDVEWRARCRT